MSEKLTIPLVGGLIAGIAASLCCAGPLVLLLLGFGGAWVSNLTALEPYLTIFIAVALTALVIAYLQLYKSTVNQPCEDGKVCANPPAQQFYKNLFWGVVAIVIASIASPYLISLIYGQ
jgi:mercuric ion transport protein